jgi:polyisoprenoid-binding protein YceI
LSLIARSNSAASPVCKCDAPRTVQLDEKNAEAFVFTFKEGVLSAIAHDLRIRVTRFSIDTDGESFVRGTFDARSLRVVCARKNGVDDTRALSDGDKRTIEGNIVRDVLQADRFPEIRFASAEVTKTERGFEVKGDLTLAGRTRSIGFAVGRSGDDGRHVAEIALHQPDFGITPYRAMLGTLRVQADVRVRVAAKIA